VKDDPDEVAMYDQMQKPSIWTIAVIFATAMVLVLLLLWTPRSDALRPSASSSAISCHVERAGLGSVHFV
jgi:hypothetical protein